MSDVELDAADFINTVPVDILIKFREEMFSLLYISKNPGRFLTYDWVDVHALQEFMQTHGSTPLRRASSVAPFSSSASLRRPPSRRASITVKDEPTDAVWVKHEDEEVDLTSRSGGKRRQSSSSAVSWRTSMNEDGTEVLEILTR
ncbi:uncharacterized protein STEHIDRAFT_158878 [Stereum hirsutum FP-91666 SS1]|uniref:uncharacterized protein n=1 Tax=Stereum hirsutum (strain FP-91666) TaxID=721885 RepID=UPI0004449282|nr:uncharacterized protein STEHIDRAFT_158878 [Stereum hirsutum FP-91666 SS1]EIM84179.1 hypothetical protein STEHIDRAFT_158878 [Stereum hirsutum FP-91666 SS1]